MVSLKYFMKRVATAGSKGTLVRQSNACLAVKLASEDALSALAHEELVWVKMVRTAGHNDVTTYC